MVNSTSTANLSCELNVVQEEKDLGIWYINDYYALKLSLQMLMNIATQTTNRLNHPWLRTCIDCMGGKTCSELSQNLHAWHIATGC